MIIINIIVKKTYSNKEQLSAYDSIQSAKLLQQNRYKSSVFYNSYASLNDVKNNFKISPTAKELLEFATEKLDISVRSYLKIIRVARTIADIDNSEEIKINILVKLCSIDINQHKPLLYNCN